MGVVTQNPEYPLGGFDWLDRNANLRQWFANWLTSHWTQIYRESVRELHSKADWKNFDRMEKAIKQLAVKLPRFPTAKQISAVDAKARKFNFKTTRDHIENELDFFLTRAGRQPEHAPAFKASPWCNHFANEQHIFEQPGTNLPYKLYPHDPNMRLVLGSVISEFGSFEISRGVSPELSQLFAVQRGLTQFDKATRSLPIESPILKAFRETEPKLREFSAMLQAEIKRRVSEPAAFFTPLRVRRLQHAFYYAVRRLCKPKDGPEKLAAFVQNLLESWPQIPAGMEFDLENHFNTDKRRDLVRGHLGLEKLQSNKEARALWRVLHAVIFRDELRGPLLRLAHDAAMRAKQRRKGWEHLRHALKTMFSHIRRDASDEAKLRNFERSNFPHMRNLTREQRMRLLPELGNDVDHSVRDLTKKERMILAARYLKKTRTALEKDADGKNSFATRYGRAMKDVRKELGQD
jgi:hypothetical protein